MFALGLSALARDPAAALLGEEGIVAAIEESKLTRARSVMGIPRAAIEWCLGKAGASWRDVEAVAVASRPLRAWTRRALMRARMTPLAPISSGYYQSKALGELGRELNNLRILELLCKKCRERIASFDHHLCHAASAFYASPFERALILTMDEQGDGRAGLTVIGEGNRIHAQRPISYPHSIAWVYSQVTELLGFRPHEEEHKTQWLSLTGEPVFADVFLDMMRRSSSLYPRLNSRFFTRGYAGRLAFSRAFYERIGLSPGATPPQDPVLRANVASSLQRACQVVVTELAESLRQRNRVRHLCLAGGLFLNPVLVAEVEKRTGFAQVFVQPAAGNEGTALGAAWFLRHHVQGRPRTGPIPHLYLGPSFSNEEIKQVLDNCKSSYRWLESSSEKIGEAIQLLRSGKIVAWYQGAAEFGPRALGNRSLLASPWAPYVKENLNDYIKRREGFRPFALSVPEEDCARYFECSPAARFMATMGWVRAEFREQLARFALDGGRVRLHAVRKTSNPLFWELLRRFGEQSLAPLLVNTSFNLFGEPLVITPRDAVRSYFCSGTDALFIGDFLLRKS